MADIRLIFLKDNRPHSWVFADLMINKMVDNAYVQHLTNMNFDENFNWNQTTTNFKEKKAAPSFPKE